jgi:ferredoxin
VDRLAPLGLFEMGALDHPDRPGRHIRLIGAAADFWNVFGAAPEASGDEPDPVDRYSKRVLMPLAEEFGGTAVFPSDGPPYAPFIAWALGSGRFWSSPVGMLVHDVAGLMVSIRGALILPGAARTADAANPCTGCPAPCRTACPVDALRGAAGYDVAACKTYLAGPDGGGCMGAGCLARRA